MARTEVQRLIDDGFAMFRWPRRCVGRFDSVFARDTVVTPYFCCVAIEQRHGASVINGGFGVIDADFEEEWQSSDGTSEAKDGGFSCSLHIANFESLTHLKFIDDSEDRKPAVEAFCGAVAGILESLPRTKEELALALTEEHLGGKPLRAWGAMGGKKFPAFLAFATRNKVISELG